MSFNNKSLRISDLDEDDDNAITATSKNIYEQLKKKSIVRSNEKLDAESREITRITPRDSEKKVDPLEGATSLRSFLKKR